MLSKLNIGNLLVVLGLGWLGFSFWVPYATADRVFRIETRASHVAAELTAAAKVKAEVDWNSDADRDTLLAATNAACGFEDPASSLYIRVAAMPPHLLGKCFLYEGKYYLYMLTKPTAKILGLEEKIIRPGAETKQEVAPDNPIPLPEEGVVPQLQLPFESYAWPKSPEKGARTVFFAPGDAAAAFTRNLSDRYAGYRRIPMPGDGRMDVSSEIPENDYRGHDNERWIYQERVRKTRTGRR